MPYGKRKINAYYMILAIFMNYEALKEFLWLKFLRKIYIIVKIQPVITVCY